MKKTFIIFGFIVAFIIVLIWSLPAAIDNDLSLIGNGKKSVVFIYDINRVVSNQQTIEFNDAKDKIEDSVNFLVTRTSYPATDELMKRYDAQSAELLFFDEAGVLFKRQFALVSAADLERIMLGDS